MTTNEKCQQNPATKQMELKTALGERGKAIGWGLKTPGKLRNWRHQVTLQNEDRLQICKNVRLPDANPNSHRRQEVYFLEGLSESDSGLRLEAGQGTENRRLSENRQLPFLLAMISPLQKSLMKTGDGKTGPKENTNVSMLEFPQRNSQFLTYSPNNEAHW